MPLFFNATASSWPNLEKGFGTLNTRDEETVTASNHPKQDPQQCGLQNTPPPWQSKHRGQPFGGATARRIWSHGKLSWDFPKA